MLCNLQNVLWRHAKIQYLFFCRGLDWGNFSPDWGNIWWNFVPDWWNLPADLGNIISDWGIHPSSLVDLLPQSFEGNRHYNAVFIKPDNIFPIRLRDPWYSTACVFRNMQLDEHI